MADDTKTPTADQELAWEAANARRAGISAIVAGGLTIVGSVLGAASLSGQPRAGSQTLTIVDTLRAAANGQPIRGGLLAERVAFFGDHAFALSLASVLVGLGAILMFPPLAYLYRAVRARRHITQAALIAVAFGSVAFGVGTIASSVPRYMAAADFRTAADQSNSAAADAVNTPLASASDLLRELGGLALAIGLVLIGLNAMRAGLLTRLMGVVAMIAGATLVIQLDQLGVLRSFWLAAFGLLLLGRTRRPPAWAVAQEVPWPSQQEIREQRDAARRARMGEPAPPRERPSRRRGAAAGAEAEAGDAAAQPATRVPAPRAPRPRREDATTGPAQPASKKRKRKRRS